MFLHGVRIFFPPKGNALQCDSDAIKVGFGKAVGSRVVQIESQWTEVPLLCTV